MKIRVDKDEWYPAYFRRNGPDRYGFEIEMSDEDFLAWQKAEEAYKDWNLKVEKLYEAAQAKARTS